MPVSKLYRSYAEAVSDVFDGATVMIDGFGGPGGMATGLILALRELGVKNLTMISNSAGIATAMGFGSLPGTQPIDHSVLIENHQIKKVIAAFPVTSSPSKPSVFELAYQQGEIDLELVPQGTLAERIRAAGAGIPAFYTPTGVGTSISEGKEARLLNGRECILEHALYGDFAFIRAHTADSLGNLVYKGTSRNFNAVMAIAARITIAEVNEVVPPGDLDPEVVITPGIYVKRIVLHQAETS